jgi:hypothetical protein
MTSKSLALLLTDLGVVKTHSRPHVSDDNPFSKAHFKTSSLGSRERLLERSGIDPIIPTGEGESMNHHFR